MALKKLISSLSLTDMIESVNSLKSTADGKLKSEMILEPDNLNGCKVKIEYIVAPRVDGVIFLWKLASEETPCTQSLYRYQREFWSLRTAPSERERPAALKWGYRDRVKERPGAGETVLKKRFCRGALL